MTAGSIQLTRYTSTQSDADAATKDAYKHFAEIQSRYALDRADLPLLLSGESGAWRFTMLLSGQE